MVKHSFSMAALALALCGAAHAQEVTATSNPWSRVPGPTAGPARSIGGPAHGCVEGALQLPAQGPGYEVVHLSRHRYYGLPETVDFVERLAARATAAGLPPINIGDMGQARGGPMPYGHAAHENGVDVDIWYTFAPPPLLSVSARETIDLPSVLQPNWKAVDPKIFGPRQIALIKLAATDPKLERIFVNSVIKALMCRVVPESDRAWLHKVRPWYGHDDHFHVRLNCPAGSPQCESGAPIPPGDGCDAVLQSWVRDQRPPPAVSPPPKPRKMPILPAECKAVLATP